RHEGTEERVVAGELVEGGAVVGERGHGRADGGAANEADRLLRAFVVTVAVAAEERVGQDLEHGAVTLRRVLEPDRERGPTAALVVERDAARSVGGLGGGTGQRTRA